MDKLLECGVSVVALDKFGKSPLHLAAEKGKEWAVKRLLDYDVSAVVAEYDCDGMMPLHYAA